MDKDIIGDVKKNLLDINKTISSLDPAIRSAAFDILAPYYFDDYEAPADESDEEEGKRKRTRGRPAGAGSFAKFMSARDHSKPTDNVYLIAAWIYSQHGAVPITTKHCEKISGETGITIPGRPDNTMRQAKRKGKKLFKQQGKGWKVTTSGELFLQETYKVRKGNKPFEDGNDE